MDLHLTSCWANHSISTWLAFAIFYFGFQTVASSDFSRGIVRTLKEYTCPSQGLGGGTVPCSVNLIFLNQLNSFIRNFMLLAENPFSKKNFKILKYFFSEILIFWKWFKNVQIFNFYGVAKQIQRRICRSLLCNLKTYQKLNEFVINPKGPCELGMIILFKFPENRL